MSDSSPELSPSPETVDVVHIDDVPVIEVAPGVTRRGLKETDFARAWLIDFEPGTQWPHVDHHASEERYYVLSGEIIEGERRYPQGTYVVFAPGSSHQPRSETGARIIGINEVHSI